MADPVFNVLFFRTGDSARSIMAESVRSCPFYVPTPLRALRREPERGGAPRCGAGSLLPSCSPHAARVGQGAAREVAACRARADAEGVRGLVLAAVTVHAGRA